jgi:G3E family GTPase
MNTYSSPEKIPVNMITGFLGSGKTTLLQRLLNDPSQKDTAVLVNEFGEVGLDHLLLQNVTESVLVMENGCVCCAIRGDLRESLTTLFSQRQGGEITQFKRVIIETSGLADPVPIAYTVLADPILQHHFRMGNIITTIDAINGLSQLSDFEEPVKQVAVADRLIVTKTDLVEDNQTDSLRAALKRINLSAPLFDAQDDDISVQQLIFEDAGSGEFRASEAAHWISGADSPQHDHSHTAGITSFVLNFDQPLDWTAFGIWMTMLLNCHGDKVLRIKGLLNVAGTAAPVLINCVQHVVHQPVHLDHWPNSDRRSRLIFIVAGLQHRQLERSLLAFNKLSNDQNENQATVESKKEIV